MIFILCHVIFNYTIDSRKNNYPQLYNIINMLYYNILEKISYLLVLKNGDLVSPFRDGWTGGIAEWDRLASYGNLVPPFIFGRSAGCSTGATLQGQQNGLQLQNEVARS